MEEGAYKVDLEPVAMVGENLLLAPLNRYVRILYVEPIPAITQDFGPIGAGATLALQKITNVDMPEDEVAQIRTKVLDDIQVEVYQKRAVGRFSTRNLLVRLTPSTGAFGTGYNTSELFVYEDEAPWVQVTNPTALPVTRSRIVMEGFRYVVQTLSETPSKYTVIPVYGWGTRGE